MLRPVTRMVCGEELLTRTRHVPGSGSFTFTICTFLMLRSSFTPVSVVRRVPVNSTNLVDDICSPRVSSLFIVVHSIFIFFLQTSIVLCSCLQIISPFYQPPSIILSSFLLQTFFSLPLLFTIFICLSYFFGLSTYTFPPISHHFLFSLLLPSPLSLSSVTSYLPFPVSCNIITLFCPSPSPHLNFIN